MAIPTLTVEQALEHERTLYAERITTIQAHRRARVEAARQEAGRRGATATLMNGVSSDDKADYCRELAAARVECRIELLRVVPELGTADKLDNLFGEIEQSVRNHFQNMIDAIKRRHLASGYPETVLDAQRAHLERQFQATAADAVTAAKRKLQIASVEQRFALPTGVANKGIVAADPLLEAEMARDFRFIANPTLKGVLERDYCEIQRAFNAGCWKSVIILSGGAIEAILLDLAERNAPTVQASTKAPKGRDLTRWDLKDLISVCVDCQLVSEGVEKLSNPVREFRNLIHPGNEVRNKLKFDAEEARIALEVLNIVHRELS